MAAEETLASPARVTASPATTFPAASKLAANTVVPSAGLLPDRSSGRTVMLAAVLALVLTRL